MPKKRKTTSENSEHRDQTTFDLFKKYWDEHPQERFFQSIRNWIGCAFLMADRTDTFFWENIRIEKSKPKVKKTRVSKTI